MTATLGIAAETFGSNEDRLVARLDYTDTLWLNNRDLFGVSPISRASTTKATARRRTYLRSIPCATSGSRNSHRSFFASLDVVASRNLDAYRQVVLGGLAGARGFDNRFQVGDRRVLLKLEERQYTDLHILNLLHVGYAAFLDIGRAWEPGVDDGLDDDVLANVGLGIRLASSKANVGRIIHIDFAFLPDEPRRPGRGLGPRSRSTSRIRSDPYLR
ncbi:MAG: hypothetical protein U5O39_06255 [Gammaproteobacteria bacterium]|nr:hypothetical protein [Gammaproteobacteria bacterium]